MGNQDVVDDLVVTAEPDASVRELATLMDRRRVGSVVIVEGRQPVGIVTDRDLTLKVLARGRSEEELTAEEVMTENLVTAPAGAGPNIVINKMVRSGVRRIPLVEEDGALVDIITLDDLMRMLAGQQVRLAEVIGRESPELFEQFTRT